MSWRAWSWGPKGWGSYEVAFLQGSLVFQPAKPGARLTLIPGFVDIHIHGGWGIDFMTATTTEILAWTSQLAEEGYDLFLPTTVTASAQEVREALDRLPSHPMIGGVHLEGPFISRRHPGAQPPGAIQDLEPMEEEWAGVLDDPRLRVATIAPELEGAAALATRLSRRGVIASMGHTDATWEQAEAGFEAGFTHTTHTYNAMRGFHHREAGAAGFALLNPDMACELIYDRHHVCREAAELLFKTKSHKKVIAVSDGTKAVGLDDGSEVDMWGTPAVVRDDTVRLKASGALAGSRITLLDAFRNLAEDFGPEVATRACCINPRLALGLDPAKARRWALLDEGFNIIDLLPMG
jgi:N-acetylglucosamine-6-phosphate deacetylase